MANRVTHYEQCPICASQGGDHSHNNLAVYEDGSKFCYAGHGAVVTSKQATGQGRTMTEKPPIKDLPNIEWLDGNTKWEEKNISASTLTELGIGVVAESPSTLAFPFYNASGVIEGYQYRDLAHERKTGQRKFSTEGRVHPFGLHKLRGASDLYLVEGISDYLSLYEAMKGDRNRPDILALPGASTHKLLTQNYSTIRRYKRIYIFPDNDQAGKQLVDNILSLKGISPYKTYVVPVQDHKDVTEYRLAGDLYYLFEAVRNTKPVADSPFLYNTQQLEDELQLQSDYKPFVTGIDALDEGMGGGIHREEFLGIVGFTGFGKSTFALYLATQIVKLNPDARVLVIGTEMNHNQNLKALAQMMTGTSWRGKPVTSTQRAGAFSQVLGNEQVFLYKKSAYEFDRVLEDIELGIVEHDINFVLIDVVTDLWRLGKLDESAAISKALHKLTLGDEEKALPPVTVVGVFHTSGANDGLSADKIRGGRAVGNQLTAAIGVTGVKNDPNVPKDNVRKIVWIKKSREHAPDIVDDFYLKFNRETMNYTEWEQEEDAEGKGTVSQRNMVQKQSRSHNSEASSRMDLRARESILSEQSPAPENHQPSEEAELQRQEQAVEADSAGISELQARLPRPDDGNTTGVQGVANGQEPENLQPSIPDIQAVIDGTRTAHDEGVGTGRTGRIPLRASWVNVDTQPPKPTKNGFPPSRVPPSYPQDYYNSGMLPTPLSPTDRAMRLTMAKGESNPVPRRRKRVNVIDK